MCVFGYLTKIITITIMGILEIATETNFVTSF